MASEYVMLGRSILRIPVCGGKDARVSLLNAAREIPDRSGLGIFDLSQPNCAYQPHHNNHQSAK
jgi:hypothetical protein